MSLFAIRLKELIDENNLHYKDIERAIDVRPYAITAFVNNKCEPDLTTLIKLVKFFGVTADYLVGRTDQKYPNNLNQLLNELKQDIEDSFNKFNSKCDSIIKNQTIH